jgi:signal transduction histidine kinase
MSILSRPNGLLLKLAAFLLLCGLPALLALDLVRHANEHRRVLQALDAPTLLDEIGREATAIGRHRRERGLAGIGLTRDLERWLLTLRQPGSSPLGDAAWSLLDYGPAPFSAMLVDAEGTVIAATRTPAPTPPHFAPAADAPVQSLVVDGARLHRVYRATLRGPGDAEEALLLWVDLPPPASRLRQMLSLQWPIVLAGAAVFALAAAVFVSAWVTRRLRRIAATADAWRRGQFELRIDDRARDEIGALAQQLDSIPAALAELVEHRSERAGHQERERIARDLHDTIKQQAFALSMQLGALRAALPEALRDLPALAETRALAEQIQRELAQLVDELRPLGHGEWRELVRARIEAWSRRNGIVVDARLDACDQVAAVRHDPLLRVLDEALANVARHSGAQRAEVALTHAGQQFRLHIADDGRGGMVEGGGRGLTHLRERAAALPDGRIEWRSSPGQGSSIELHWTETVT